ncbi:hypothetical protein LK13_04610 [Paenibacillus polymyxa]|uniref:hypothetical protein n=1 Tax=Paenibacillus polymyxa TaxID=1406 RepID=UPI00046CDEA9|nr:hypothetical protein [Paenibacillus polymyxa]AIY07919.1 hypothetical protein LK13_04610 [Paenibacillus polymyxa]KJK31397.1 hypothetical protein TY89_08430 [Paenibacillus polymyxa]
MQINNGAALKPQCTKTMGIAIDKYSVGNRNAHHVIGQEFDKVAVVINERFYYNDSGQLLSIREAGAPPYRMDKMLYQMLTRARQEITVVIYKNKDMRMPV